MDGWLAILRPFNSISVISGRWESENERLCAIEPRILVSKYSAYSRIRARDSQISRSALKPLSYQGFYRAEPEGVKLSQIVLRGANLNNSKNAFAHANTHLRAIFHAQIKISYRFYKNISLMGKGNQNLILSLVRRPNLQQWETYNVLLTDRPRSPF